MNDKSSVFFQDTIASVEIGSQISKIATGRQLYEMSIVYRSKKTERK